LLLLLRLHRLLLVHLLLAELFAPSAEQGLEEMNAIIGLPQLDSILSRLHVRYSARSSVHSRLRSCCQTLRWLRSGDLHLSHGNWGSNGDWSSSFILAVIFVVRLVSVRLLGLLLCRWLMCQVLQERQALQGSVLLLLLHGHRLHWRLLQKLLLLLLLLVTRRQRLWQWLLQELLLNHLLRLRLLHELRLNLLRWWLLHELWLHHLLLRDRNKLLWQLLLLLQDILLLLLLLLRRQRSLLEHRLLKLLLRLN